MPLKALATSIMPKFKEAEWKTLNKDLEAAEKTLKKDKKDEDALKVVKDYDAKVKKLEAELKSVLDALEDKLEDIEEFLVKITKRVPEPLEKTLKQLATIAKSSRAPEIKDLRKDQKQNLLRSNPSKLERLIGDLNDDVTKANALEAGIDDVDKEYAKKVKDLGAAIESDLDKPVSGATIMLPILLKKFHDTNQALGWAGFDAAAKAFKKSCAVKGAEALRKLEIQALQSSKDFSALNSKKKNKIIEAGVAGKDTVAKVRAELLEALNAQLELEEKLTKNLRTPRQKAWAKLLRMEGYGKDQAGTYDGVKMHVTYDNNSWTPAAYAGVSLDQTVEQIYDALFEVSDWSYQFHATLELPNNSGDNPHIYAFGEAQPKRWKQVQKDNDKDDKWINGAKAAVQKALDDFIKKVKADIKKAKA
ncbi:MAG: hypothetical protein ACOH2H_11865 [Cypionkella sp.]